MLEHLLFPYKVEQFLQENWTRLAVHIPACDRHKFADVFSWRSLNHLLNFHQLGDPNIHFSLDGKSFSDMSRKHWRDYLQQGATLVINGIDERVPEVQQLARGLSQEIGHRVQTNLYCSPAMQRGFSCHYDTHDVMILQIEGDKQWFVFPETVSFPTAEMRSSDRQPPDAPPYLQCNLQQGDLLYIPRGHWHYAIAGDCPSLHLTVGIDCFTGLHWLNWLNLDLQEQTGWRQNLPLVMNGDSQDLEQHLEDLRQQLIKHLQQPDLFKKYLRDLPIQNQDVAPFSLPTQLGFNIFDRGLESAFTFVPHQQIEIAIFDDQHQEITCGSKQISIKGLPIDFIQQLFQLTHFSILDLADFAPDLDLETEVVPLLTRLVTEGILLVD
ncbi:JmjC domain-containing protein [Pseudanabaena mucicola]|uniref:Transcription factor jumonji jmjC domain-containing protein n=1 Tax=Pseudanabaena mucicola FACHB-723 TaxID=2692860 RepID=A0ABR8A0L5_9CYAN|nr:cupin domain-containing protein [Pseudanabaena mucicola]MBD2189599.1 transcription factor jumonji jmjC domain-containing protein [Pseudanabaena mucicola FACHB-723]